MAAQPTPWPEPDISFEWIGEADILWDQNTAVVAITGVAIHKAYSTWHAMHQETSAKIHKLENEVNEMKNDEGKPLAFKIRI